MDISSHNSYHHTQTIGKMNLEGALRTGWNLWPLPWGRKHRVQARSETWKRGRNRSYPPGYRTPCKWPQPRMFSWRHLQDGRNYSMSGYGCKISIFSTWIIWQAFWWNCIRKPVLFSDIMTAVFYCQIRIKSYEFYYQISYRNHFIITFTEIEKHHTWERTCWCRSSEGSVLWK